MNVFKVFVETTREKNSGLNRIRTHDLCRCQCSALPTELSSQLGADHFVSSLIFFQALISQLLKLCI